MTTYEDLQRQYDYLLPDDDDIQPSLRNDSEWRDEQRMHREDERNGRHD